MHGLHRGDGARWFSCGFEVIGSADPAFRAVCDTCTQAFLRPRQSAQRDSATVRQPSGPGRTLRSAHRRPGGARGQARHDLFVGLRTKPSKDRPTAAALPRTPDERAYWTQQVRMGYTHGRQLADQILERNRARLDRTFLGMLRYTALLKRGLVVEPTVSAAPAIVTGDATHLNIGDTLYRITDPGGLILDARRWRPVVAPASSSGTKP